MRTVTCARPDGGTDVYFLMPDGTIRHTWYAGNWEDPSLNPKGVDDPSCGGHWAGLLKCGWQSGYAYCDGWGIGAGAIYRVQWAPGHNWEGPIQVA